MPLSAIQQTMVVLDFETTGRVGRWPDEPWQIGLLELRGGRVDVSSFFESLLRVESRPWSPKAPVKPRDVTALASAPTLPLLWPELRRRMRDRPLVAHNIGTERAVLRRSLPLWRPSLWIDTLRLARLAYPRLASHALAELVDALGLEGRVRECCPGRAAHDALYDAVAAAVLLEHLLAQPGWEGATAESLADARPSVYYRCRRISR